MFITRRKRLFRRKRENRFDFQRCEILRKNGVPCRLKARKISRWRREGKRVTGEKPAAANSESGGQVAKKG